jgi:hypothetical protein
LKVEEKKKAAADKLEQQEEAVTNHEKAKKMELGKTINKVLLTHKE